MTLDPHIRAELKRRGPARDLLRTTSATYGREGLNAPTSLSGGQGVPCGDDPQQNSRPKRYCWLPALWRFTPPV